jgi:hypothetical protein
MAQPQGSNPRPIPHPQGGQHAPTIGVDTLDHRHLYEFDNQLEQMGEQMLDFERARRECAGQADIAW